MACFQPSFDVDSFVECGHAQETGAGNEFEELRKQLQVGG